MRGERRKVPQEKPDKAEDGASTANKTTEDTADYTTGDGTRKDGASTNNIIAYVHTNDDAGTKYKGIKPLKRSATSDMPTDDNFSATDFVFCGSTTIKRFKTAPETVKTEALEAVDMGEQQTDDNLQFSRSLHQFGSNVGP